MTLKSDAKFEEKLTCYLENDIRNLTNFQLKVSKLEYIVQSRKCMSLKFTEKLCVMTMKNDTKIEEELTCCFNIDMNFTNFDISIQKV